MTFSENFELLSEINDIEKEMAEAGVEEIIAIELEIVPDDATKTS